MSKRTRSQYIDDSAEVDHDPLTASPGPGTSTWKSSTLVTKKDCALMRHTDPDSVAAIRRETPSRGDDFDYNIPSRAPSPVPAWTAPSQAVSRASTPLYSRPKMICLGTRRPRYSSPSATRRPLFARLARSTPYAFNLRGETPTFFPTLVGPIPRRQETPLFEGLRLPPPQRDLTPVSPVTSPAPSRPTSPEPPAKKRRVDSGADAEDSPHRRRLHRFLDNFWMTSQYTTTPSAGRPVFPEEDETEDDLRALAAAYEDAGREYSRAAREETLLLQCALSCVHYLRPAAVVEDTSCRTLVIPNTSPQRTARIDSDEAEVPRRTSVHIHSSLAEGDRVVVVHGPPPRRDRLHCRPREVPVSGQRVKYAKILKDYNGVDILKKEDAGFQGFLTVAASSNSEIVGATTTSEISDRQVFQISIRYVNRDFRCGDLGDKPKPEQTEFPDHVFKVRAADVDFATYDERESGLTIEHAGISSYTPPVTSPLRRHACPGSRERHAQRLSGTVIGDHDNAARVRGWPKSAGKGRTHGVTRTRTGSSPSGANGPFDGGVTVTNASTDTIHSTCLPLTKARFLPHDVLMGHVAPRQRPFFKGLSGAENSTSSAYAFSAPFKRSALGINSSAALAWRGRRGWMCIPGLSGKRFDVQVVGITGVKERTSPTLLALEGRHGHILANAPIQRGTKKLDVCGVGKSGTKHAVYAQCIKPRRKDDDGRSLTEISQRVVVIGPDMGEGTSFGRAATG
ncbi:hypothetical protein B0H13DRAFT_1914897 [Mycena leptocephala]|nr:hypothetical protein B0H13DRAFT_1914897 [Mycena leptocephala]